MRRLVMVLVSMLAFAGGRAAHGAGPATAVAAGADAEELSRQTEQRLGITLFKLPSQHFVVYTDFGPNEFKGLLAHLEGTYGRLAAQFDVPRERVAGSGAFTRPLPVFMFASAETLRRFGRELDQTQVPDLAVAYFRPVPGSTGHLVASLPPATSDGGPLGSARQMFQYTLAHEMVHALIHGLYPDAKLPVWLNEGIAEACAQRLYPRRDVLPTARTIAGRETSIQHVFAPDDPSLRNVDYYPVFTTLVRTLLAENRRGLPALIRATATKPFAEALQETYGWSTEDLEKHWRDDLNTVTVRPRRT